MGLTFQRFGPASILVDFSDRIDESAFERSRRIQRALETSPPSRLREFIPAFRTLLCEFEPGPESAFRTSWTELETLLRVAVERESDAPVSRVVEIPVHYGGPDLARVAGSAGMGAREVVELHSGGAYRVHCLGFSPGFPYLNGMDARLHTPRLAVPRAKVPLGSVAIGGEHTGIYSLPTAGGWNLIGRTPSRLFQPEAPDADGMFLLRSGDWVRFTQLTEAPAIPAPVPEPHCWGPSRSKPCLRVLHPGVRTTIQDLGRPGWRRFGVPPGGAMDPVAAAEANLLVGNPPDAPVLELCLQGQQFEVLHGAWISVGGPDTGGTLKRAEAQWMRAGSVLRFPQPFVGTWVYLAVEGGVCGRRLLGSFSTNPTAGMGRDLATGDEVFHGPSEATRAWAPIARRLISDLARRDFAHPPVLRVWPGPQWGKFSDLARDTFFATPWKVSSQSDRAGYRLDGAEILPPAGSLASEPVLVGSIQVPPGGQPIVTMPDGPTIGGYHKLGVVDPEDLRWLVQTPPGRCVRFRPI